MSVPLILSNQNPFPLELGHPNGCIRTARTRWRLNLRWLKPWHPDLSSPTGSLFGYSVVVSDDTLSKAMVIFGRVQVTCKGWEHISNVVELKVGELSYMVRVEEEEALNGVKHWSLASSCPSPAPASSEDSWEDVGATSKVEEISINSHVSVFNSLENRRLKCERKHDLLLSIAALDFNDCVGVVPSKNLEPFASCFEEHVPANASVGFDNIDLALVPFADANTATSDVGLDAPSAGSLGLSNQDLTGPTTITSLASAVGRSCVSKRLRIFKALSDCWVGNKLAKFIVANNWSKPSKSRGLIKARKRKAANKREKILKSGIANLSLTDSDIQNMVKLQNEGKFLPVVDDCTEDL